MSILRKSNGLFSFEHFAIEEPAAAIGIWEDSLCCETSARNARNFPPPPLNFGVPLENEANFALWDGQGQNGHLDPRVKESRRIKRIKARYCQFAPVVVREKAY